MIAVKRIPDLPFSAWTRECQECGYIQEDTAPNGNPNLEWLAHRCSKCKAKALDFGTMNGSWSDYDVPV